MIGSDTNVRLHFHCTSICTSIIIIHYNILRHVSTVHWSKDMCICVCVHPCPGPQASMPTSYALMFQGKARKKWQDCLLIK